MPIQNSDLDMGLVRDIDRDKTKGIVAHKLIETVKELKFSTIAEGIERIEELDWMRKVGADFVQGFFFARPAVPPPGLVAN